MSERDEVEYSEKVKGDRRNYGWTVRFDDCDGFLGVTQPKDAGGVDRVLLSPKQAEALIAFYRKWHPEKKRRRVSA